MKATIQLVKPEDSLATVTITATMGEFEAVEKALHAISSWPIHSFRVVLSEVIRKAREEFTSRSEMMP